MLATIDWQKLTGSAIVAYIISYTYLFITTPFFQHLFGKINGAIINYAISWGFFALIVYIMHTSLFTYITSKVAQLK
jgi:hypothetical protein